MLADPLATSKSPTGLQHSILNGQFFYAQMAHSLHPRRFAAGRKGQAWAGLLAAAADMLAAPACLRNRTCSRPHRLKSGRSTAWHCVRHHLIGGKVGIGFDIWLLCGIMLQISLFWEKRSSDAAVEPVVDGQPQRRSPLDHLLRAYDQLVGRLFRILTACWGAPGR